MEHRLRRRDHASGGSAEECDMFLASAELYVTTPRSPADAVVYGRGSEVNAS
jgi:hypothetical protein